MLKETKSEKTLSFGVIIISLVAFQLGGGPLALPLATPETRKVYKNLVVGNSIRLLLAILPLDLQLESSFAETFLSKIFFADFFTKTISN